MLVKPTATDFPEGTGNCDEHKHLVDVKAFVEALSERGLKQKGSMEIPMKVEKVDRSDPVRTDVPGKTVVASDREGSSLPKESVKEEPKDESQFEQGGSGSACSMVMDSANSKPVLSDLRNSHHAVLDTPNLPESDNTVLPSSKPDKTEVKIEGGDDKSAGNPKSPFYPITDGKLDCMDHLPYNPQKPLGQSSESLQDRVSVTALPLELKSQDVKKESEINHRGCDELTEATFSTIMRISNMSRM